MAGERGHSVPWRAEAAAHVTARLVSAVASFALFASFARALPPVVARDVFFFLFGLGFVIATVRTYCLLTAALVGAEQRSAKLRRVVKMTNTIPWITLVAVVSTGIIAARLNLEWGIVLAALGLVASCTFDTDLVRAIVGRAPSFSSAFAVGSCLALLFFYLATPSGRNGCIAVMLQWVPVAAMNWNMRWRLHRLVRLRVREDHVRSGIFVGMLVAVFDGAVLNAPFIVNVPLSDQAALDVSIAMRLFVASLPLLPLFAHWSNDGRLAGWSAAMGRSEQMLYAALVAGTGAVAGVTFAVIFTLLSAQTVSMEQLGFFAMLLLVYAVYAAFVRYQLGALSEAGRGAVMGATLGAFYLLLLTKTPSGEWGAAVTIALQVGALLTVPLLGRLVAGGRAAA